MNASIIIIGSELLTPGKNDTHSEYLIEKLTSIGIAVVSRSTIGDARDLIAETAGQALVQADLVIATGGLGPTSDDVTREGFADAMGLELIIDEQVMSGIRRRFRRRGVEMPDVNRRQAMVLSGAEVIPNPAGLAPALWIKWRGSRNKVTEVVLLPGPPRELRTLFEDSVLPRLGHRGGKVVFRTERLFIAGLPESSVEEKIGPIYSNVKNPQTSILASGGQVELRLTARDESFDEAGKIIEELKAPIRTALGHHIFSECGERLEEVVGRLLTRAGKTISIAESCTGGLITHRMTGVAGSSNYFERGLVTYSNASKVELLGVPEKLLVERGAVSEEVVLAMAHGVRELSGTDLGLAVTGIAGPHGGSPEKPVGLVYVGLSDEKGEKAHRYLLPGNRYQIKTWTAQLALNLLRLRLL